MSGGGLLGLLACAAMAGASCCHAMPVAAHQMHGMPHKPSKAPDPTGGCHAAMNCAAHRKARGGMQADSDA